MANIIPEVGSWVTLKTEFGEEGDGAGKVLEVDHQRKKFFGHFFTEDSNGPSLEAEEWFDFSEIHGIISDPKIIEEQEKDYRMASGS